MTSTKMQESEEKAISRKAFEVTDDVAIFVEDTVEDPSIALALTHSAVATAMLSPASNAKDYQQQAIEESMTPSRRAAAAASRNHNNNNNNNQYGYSNSSCSSSSSSSGGKNTNNNNNNSNDVTPDQSVCAAPGANLIFQTPPTKYNENDSCNDQHQQQHHHCCCCHHNNNQQQHSHPSPSQQQHQQQNQQQQFLHSANEWEAMKEGIILQESKIQNSLTPSKNNLHNNSSHNNNENKTPYERIAMSRRVFAMADRTNTNANNNNNNNNNNTTPSSKLQLSKSPASASKQQKHSSLLSGSSYSTGAYDDHNNNNNNNNNHNHVSTSTSPELLRDLHPVVPPKLTAEIATSPHDNNINKKNAEEKQQEENDEISIAMIEELNFLRKENARLQTMYEYQKSLADEYECRRSETDDKLQAKIMEVVGLSSRLEESKRFVRQLKKESNENRMRTLTKANSAIQEEKLGSIKQQNNNSNNNMSPGAMLSQLDSSALEKLLEPRVKAAVRNIEMRYLAVIRDQQDRIQALDELLSSDDPMIKVAEATLIRNRKLLEEISSTSQVATTAQERHAAAVRELESREREHEAATAQVRDQLRVSQRALSGERDYVDELLTALDIMKQEIENLKEEREYLLSQQQDQEDEQEHQRDDQEEDESPERKKLPEAVTSF